MKRQIGAGLSSDLSGLSLHYEYSTGAHCELSFERDRVSFSISKAAHTERGCVPYLARRIRERQYLVHWLLNTSDAGAIHVTLLIDLADNKVYVAALMPHGVEFFDAGELQNVSREIDQTTSNQRYIW